MLPSRFSSCIQNRISRRGFLVGSVAIALCAASLAGASGLSTLPDQVPSVIQRSQLVGHADPGQTLHINVCLQPPSPAALQAFADSVSDPASPNYRHFLTPTEIGEKFGQPASTVSSMVKYLQGQGMNITLVAHDNLHVMADGTVQQVESAFNTTVNRYHLSSPEAGARPDYYSFAKAPQLPSGLAPAVQHVEGLHNIAVPRPMTTLTPSQARTLYNIAPAFSSKLYGQGRTVGISNWDGYRLSNVPVWYSKYSLPAPAAGVGSNITVVKIDGGSGTNPPGAEGDLDIQMVLGQAPQCNLIIYDGSGADRINVTTKELDDNLADVITESYGWNESYLDTASSHTLHVEMSAAGITYMNATGDSGTSIEPFAYPDMEPETLGVGGSAAQVDSAGNRQSEVAWDGGGSGWSTFGASFNTLPSWQKGPGVPTSINFRLRPDVSGHAAGDQHLQFENAYYFIYAGSVSDISGTSCASPIFAGELAVSEQKLIGLGGLPKDKNGKQRFGRIQDLFYSQKMRKDVWFDITVGDTGALPNGQQAVATTGWDFASGLGCINWDGFVKAVVNPPLTAYATSASIYTDPTAGTLGQNPTGNYTNLAAEDNLFYTINSVSQPAGQTAAALIGYTLTDQGANLSGLSLNLAMVAPQGTSVFIYEYIYNPSNGSYTLFGKPISTQTMNGSDTAFTVQLGPPAQVTNGKQLLFVARALYPSHLGNFPFTFKIDQATVTEFP